MTHTETHVYRTRTQEEAHARWTAIGEARHAAEAQSADQRHVIRLSAPVVDADDSPEPEV